MRKYIVRETTIGSVVLLGIFPKVKLKIKLDGRLIITEVKAIIDSGVSNSRLDS